VLQILWDEPYQASTDTATKQPQVTPEAYDRIRLGIKKEEVLALLGRPPDRNVTDEDRVASPLRWRSIFTMDVSGFDSLENDAIRQKGHLWKIPTCRIWVAFDERQRVIGKVLETPPPASKTPRGPQ
jgi:hypothetical protein